MSKMNDLSISDLKALVRLDQESGLLFWKEREPRFFCEGPKTQDHMAAIFNANHSGKQAFKNARCDGYLQGKLLGKSYLAHRVVYAIAYGAWPCGEVDHIDGNRQNNKPENLRDVTREGNQHNAALRADNSTGYTGVSRSKSKTGYRADIRVNTRRIHLGSFRCLTAAAVARKAAEKKYGFHENHGREARK